MLKISGKDDFIFRIKIIDKKLENIRLSEVKIDKAESKITYVFVCDETVDDDLKSLIRSKAREMTSPTFFLVSVEVIKMATDSELVNNTIFKYLKTEYPSLSIFLTEKDVESKLVDGKMNYTLHVDKDGADYLIKNCAINKLNDYLSRNFCCDFSGGTVEKKNSEMVDLTDEKVFIDQLEKMERRTIKVSDITVIDDMTIGDTAEYIEDVSSGNVVVTGKITDITERETKTGKPYFLIKIDDTTGRISGLYFTRKNTYEKIRLLHVGDGIIARASFDGDDKRLKFEKINTCVFPEHFEKKSKLKTTPPPFYKISPQKAETISVKSVFDNSFIPNCLKENDYVVFDLETTGLDLMNNGITEIGAVKITKGSISETWTTLVKPDYPITDEITKLTGITEDMVKNSPKIGDVIPDFIKFINGTILIAHNAEFDVKFIKKFATLSEYEITNKVMDTYEISRNLLPSLKNHKLNTLAEHFGIVFHHHRALSDAYATAEVFIELMKLKAQKEN